MAEEVKKEEVKEVKKAVKFFRSKEFSGLTIILNADVTDPTMIEEVRFTPVREKYQGDEVKVGYLKTEDPRVIKICAEDSNVEEIDEKEFPVQLNK